MAVSIPISSNTRFLRPGGETLPLASDPAVNNDLWIFREGSRIVSGRAMLRDLLLRLERYPQYVVDALIRAGVLEAALSDAGHASAAAAEELTDVLATLLCGGQPSRDPVAIAKRSSPPETLLITPPEGFSYYALHPLDFARAVSQIPVHFPACAVVGVRSIGTTLSAVTVSALRLSGRPAERITVRPSGHPYHRTMRFTAEQLRWVRQQTAIPAQFVIVDEGPGRSGSTFLSVAESLLRAGVPSGTITIIGSHEFDFASLCAQDGKARWKAFRFISAAPSVHSWFEKCSYAGGGEWRNWLGGRQETWPESWTQMERLKFLSPDRKTLFKFEGLGPSGDAARGRASLLGEAGLSPKSSDADHGFLAYTWLGGQPLSRKDLSVPFLEHIAQYCAFRALNFAADSEQTELGQMLEHNVQQEFGCDLALHRDEFIPRNLVLADGRMQPFEWVASGGRFYKTDAISHGDDHFFPGPCDVAWDLAGAAVEWHLDPSAMDFLVTRFRQLSGIDASRRIPIYTLAYCVFRLGFCKMAASAAPNLGERRRLLLAHRGYRAQAALLLCQRGLSPLQTPTGFA